MHVDESRRSSLLGFAALALAASVPGCGGGGADSTAAPQPTLKALELISTATALPPGQVASLTAIARFSDGSSVSLAGMANWSSSNPASATVDSEGRVTAVADGSSTITVSYQSMTARVDLRVGLPLQSLEIQPVPFQLALGLGGTWQLFSLGHTATRSANVNALALWTSSDPNVATVGQGAQGGLLKGMGAGTTTISCVMDGITAQLRVTVMPHQRIAGVEDDIMALECAIAAESNGRVLAVWSRWFQSSGRPDLSWVQFRPGVGWSAPASLRPLPLSTDARSSSLQLALQESGSGWAAWQQLDGLFAARFDSIDGWGPPVQVDPAGAFFGEPVRLQLGRNGDGMLVWRAVIGGAIRLWFSLLNGTTGRWSQAAMVPGTDFDGALVGWKCVTNRSGGVTVLWTRQEVGPTAREPNLLVVRWQPGRDGQAGQWLPLETLLSSNRFPDDFAACMDDDGVILVGWIRPTGRTNTAGRDTATLQTRRYLPGDGWQPEQVLVAETDTMPRSLALASAAGRGAGAIWRFQGEVRPGVAAGRMAADGSWQLLGEASDNAHALAEVGDPSQLELTQLNDGRLIFSWLASDNMIAGTLATRVHHPTTGWGPLRRETGTGCVGNTSCMDLAYTDEGKGSVVWLDTRQEGSDLFGRVGWQP